ncbi:MAG: ABC transporter permease [Bacteroidota bacterium]
MKAFFVALHIEFLKAIKSKVFWATLIFFGFIAVMMGFIMLIAKNPEIAGNSEVLSIKASMISNPVWPVFYMLLIQMVITVGSLGPSIVAIWVFGREYSDRTMKDILVMPVSRLSIVMAKFIVVTVWSLLLLILLYVFSIFMGLVINLDGWTNELFSQKTILYSVSALLTVLLFPVIALITCASRGYLLPVGITILLMITTQFVSMALPAITPWFPWAIPALYSGVAGPLSPEPVALSYIILGLTSLVGIAGTAAWWRYADQH